MNAEIAWIIAVVIAWAQGVFVGWYASRLWQRNGIEMSGYCDQYRENRIIIHEHLSGVYPEREGDPMTTHDNGFAGIPTKAQAKALYEKLGCDPIGDIEGMIARDTAIVHGTLTDAYAQGRQSGLDEAAQCVNTLIGHDSGNWNRAMVYAQAAIRARAMQKKVTQLRQALNVELLVNRFLSWPLPNSVCSDICATQQCTQHRSGTTLLSATEAKQMLEYVLASILATEGDLS